MSRVNPLTGKTLEIKTKSSGIVEMKINLVMKKAGSVLDLYVKNAKNTGSTMTISIFASQAADLLNGKTITLNSAPYFGTLARMKK